MLVVDSGGNGGEPVSIAEAKAWCRIDRGDEDSLIGALIAAARETVERETGLVLVERTFRLVLDAAPRDGRVVLPRRPLRALTSVTAFDAEGLPIELPASEAKVDVARGTGTLRLSDAMVRGAAGGIEIEFAAGYASADVPEALKLGVKQIVAASYELRGAVAADMQPAIVPKAARDLIAPFRQRRL